MKRLITGAAALAAICISNPVSADSIDGDWCHAASGKHLNVDGPTIITPGGKRIEGDYHRHGFSYKIPAGEKAAGATVNMTQQDEQTMHLTGGFAGNAVQEWRRCSRPTS